MLHYAFRQLVTGVVKDYFFDKGCTSFTKIYAPPQGSSHLKVDMKQVPHWGPTNIRRHCTKSNHIHQQTHIIQSVPLATELGISLIILPLIRILLRNSKRTTDTFLFISHTTNVLLFKYRCNIFIGVRIIKEMLGSVASGTHCMITN